MREILVGLLEDWGAFLEIPLYLDALTHFLGGEDVVLRTVPLMRSGVPLGGQRFHFAGAQTVFRLTALTDAVEGYEEQLHSLPHHTPLRAIQWINMARHQIDFITLEK